MEKVTVVTEHLDVSFQKHTNHGQPVTAIYKLTNFLTPTIQSNSRASLGWLWLLSGFISFWLTHILHSLGFHSIYRIFSTIFLWNRGSWYELFHFDTNTSSLAQSRNVRNLPKSNAQYTNYFDMPKRVTAVTPPKWLTDVRSTSTIKQRESIREPTFSGAKYVTYSMVISWLTIHYHQSDDMVSH